jgi:hypothetical protein
MHRILDPDPQRCAHLTNTPTSTLSNGMWVRCHVVEMSRWRIVMLANCNLANCHDGEL